MKPRATLGLVSVLAACSREPPPAPSTASNGLALVQGIVAQIGATTIPATLVADVARARRESGEGAARQLVEDALLAEGAVARGIDRDPEIAWSLSATRASFVVDAARAAAASPEPTDEELRERAAAHWREVDLPEQFHVAHAVVLRPSPETPESDARAKALAATIATAVATAASPEAFEAKASAVAHPGLDVRVERLPAFVADGRASEGPPDAAFDQTFAAAAAALKAPGATTDVVETKFGWHVIRLIEKLPAHRLSLDELRARFSDEVRAKRARKRIDDLLAVRRAATRVVTVENADALLGEVRAVGP